MRKITRRNKLAISLGLLLLFFAVFSQSLFAFFVSFEKYDGRSLTIGVVGEPPEVREEQVNFKQISFEDLNKEDLRTFDAVFITKENLAEASEGKYAEVYSQSDIPFVFIQTTKSYLPFIDNEHSYHDEIFESLKDDQYYATLYIENNQHPSGHFWGYGLYNDKENKWNVKDVYSRVFTSIEKIKNKQN
ncbi:transcription elongation factor GreAB [Jeotgalibacillus proteolyticus]|uniref:Transcription elongation factor GreAB n=1 Tax=Jeotgalibacillus proteolyticus TaxID=2082395 RepID=A0A2S5GDE1_9BACL|nr:transcription elongation factor GreAB [Jeotgalibacillus proteolyticus]PPA70913.1 transcription elongation factor GreAB [Jeotgalibacillus proteolyticus]